MRYCCSLQEEDVDTAAIAPVQQDQTIHHVPGEAMGPTERSDQPLRVPPSHESERLAAENVDGCTVAPERTEGAPAGSKEVAAEDAPSTKREDKKAEVKEVAKEDTAPERPGGAMARRLEVSLNPENTVDRQKNRDDVEAAERFYHSPAKAIIQPGVPGPDENQREVVDDPNRRTGLPQPCPGANPTGCPQTGPIVEELNTGRRNRLPDPGLTNGCPRTASQHQSHSEVECKSDHDCKSRARVQNKTENSRTIDRDKENCNCEPKGILKRDNKEPEQSNDSQQTRTVKFKDEDQIVLIPNREDNNAQPIVQDSVASRTRSRSEPAEIPLTLRADPM